MGPVPNKPASGGTAHQATMRGAALANRALDVHDAVNEYDQLRKQGVSQPEAAARSGARLLFGNEVRALDHFEQLRQSGISTPEAVASTAGDYVGAVGLKPTLGGVIASTTNRLAKTVGAPAPVTDATQIAANVFGFEAEVLKEGARSWVNVADFVRTGNAKGLERQVGEWKAGDTPLAGYALVTDIAADMASGKSFYQAADKATKAGKNSILGRAGSFAGDVAFADVTGVSSMVTDLKQGKSFAEARKNARAKIIESMGSNNETLKTVQKVDESINRATDWVGNKTDQAKDYVAGKTDQAAAWVGEKTEKAGQWVGEKTDKAVAGVTGAKDYLADKWRSLW
jgi:hypothetical protein